MTKCEIIHSVSHRTQYTPQAADSYSTSQRKFFRQKFRMNFKVSHACIHFILLGFNSLNKNSELYNHKLFIIKLPQFFCYSLLSPPGSFSSAFCSEIPPTHVLYQGYRPEDGSSTHLWNVGQLLWEYTAQYPRKLCIIITLTTVWTSNITSFILCEKLSFIHTHKTADNIKRISFCVMFMEGTWEVKRIMINVK